MKLKTFQIASIGAALGISFFVTKPVQAVNLTPVVNVDTLTKLDVSWQGSGLDDGAPNNDSLGAPTLVNWIIPLTELKYLGGGNGWTGTVQVRHKTDPHPEIGENGGGLQATLAIAFNQLGITNTSSSASVKHPPIHFDKYLLAYKYTPSKDSVDSKDTLYVRLTAEHVPEPLTILGSATALGFGAFFKRKLKSSESSEKETINVG